MRVGRGLLGGLLWIVAGLVGLVAVLLCVTLVLLPVGIPLLMLSRRLFGSAVRLMLPRALAHPGKEVGRRGKTVKDSAGRTARSIGKSGRKQVKRTKTGKLLGRKKHRLSMPW